MYSFELPSIMDMADEVYGEAQICMFGIVYQVNSMPSELNGYFLYRRLASIVATVVASNMDNLAIQPLFIIAGFHSRSLALFPSSRIFEVEIAEFENQIIGLYSLVPVSDYDFVHLLQRLKWAIAVFYNVGMRKVRIAYEPYVHFFLRYFIIKNTITPINVKGSELAITME